MRILSGTTDQYIPFYAVDSTDLKTPETGLSSFTVTRSRNGATEVTMTTPTIVETSAGNYWLLMDEDMTIGAGNITEAMVFNVTHAGMAPVPLQIELFDQSLLSGIDTKIDTMDAVADAIKVVTDNLPDNGALTALLADIASILTDTGTTLDTKVNAIQAKTDQLVFTKANEVDANIQSINGAEVTGDGNATAWDGA